MNGGGAFSSNANRGEAWPRRWGTRNHQQVLDRQETDQLRSLRFYPGSSVLLFAIDDHQGMSDPHPGLTDGGNGFEDRSPAGEHVVDDQRPISRLKGAFDQLPEPMILGLFSHDKGPPLFPRNL